MTLKKPEADIVSLALCTDALKLAAGTDDGMLLLWNLPERLLSIDGGDREIERAEPQIANPLTFQSNDGIAIEVSSRGRMTREAVSRALRELLSQLRSETHDP